MVMNETESFVTTNENKNEHESHGQARICITQLADVTSFAFFKKNNELLFDENSSCWCFHFFSVSGYQYKKFHQ